MKGYTRMPEPRGDVTRLPKWAQQYIANLERQIEDQGAHIEDISSPHPESNVILQGGIEYPDVTLPNDSNVYFYFGDPPRERLFDMIEIHHNHDERTLSVTSYGRGYLNINPQASNAIRLWIGDRS